MPIMYKTGSVPIIVHNSQIQNAINKGWSSEPEKLEPKVVKNKSLKPVKNTGKYQPKIKE